MGYVQFATIAAALVAMTAAAISVFACWRSSKSASKLRGMSSLHAELLEIRDYCAKVDAWAKRINAREVMAARRSPPAASDELDLGGTMSKAELRRRVGLVPGRPAPHG